MLLSLRGWGREDFRLATPEFAEAARWAIFAEGGVRELTQARQIEAEPFGADMTNPANVQLIRAKGQAKDVIAAWTDLLYPADE